jgi:hypothetical protein
MWGDCLPWCVVWGTKRVGSGGGVRAEGAHCLLDDVIGAVYDWLGFDVVADAAFRDLVIVRIVEPASKLDLARVLAGLGARRCPIARFNDTSIRSGRAGIGMPSPPNALSAPRIAAH